MIRMENLAAELITEIGTYCSWRDKRSLRLVCRYFSSVIQYILFSKLTLELKVTRLSHARNKELLSALATRSTGIRELPRTLVVNYTWINALNVLSTDSLECIRQDLLPAISCLNKVKTAIWYADHDSPVWLHDLIFEGLKSLPRLENLQIQLLISTGLHLTQDTQISSLDHFSRLRSFKYSSLRSIKDDNFVITLGRLLAKCPDISTLEIKPNEGSQLGFHHLFACIPPGQILPLECLNLRGFSICAADIRSILPHIKNLKTLELCNNSTVSSASGQRYSPNRDIWLILRNAAIFVIYLTTDIVDEALIAYLCSFRGLRKLKLMHSSFNDWHLPGDPIFNSVIFTHCQSLLKIDFEHPGGISWPLSEQRCDVLISCHRLRRFSISMMYAVDRMTSLVEFGQNFPQLQHLRVLSEHFSSEYISTQCLAGRKCNFRVTYNGLTQY